MPHRKRPNPLGEVAARIGVFVIVATLAGGVIARASGISVINHRACAAAARSRCWGAQSSRPRPQRRVVSARPRSRDGVSAIRPFRPRPATRPVSTHACHPSGLFNASKADAADARIPWLGSIRGTCGKPPISGQRSNAIPRQMRFPWARPFPDIEIDDQHGNRDRHCQVRHSDDRRV